MTPPRQNLVLQPNWVRSTYDKENLGFRHLNRMSPLVTDDLVVQGNGVDGIAAYARRSGHLQWRLNINNGVEAGVQLQDGKLYFGAGDGNFYAVNVKDGSVLWKFPIHAEGIAQPLVRNGKVFFLAGNNVAYALDAQTGKRIWLFNRQETGSFTIRGGAQPAAMGDVIYLGFSGGEFIALNMKDGSVVWERQLSQGSRFKDVDATPVIDGDYIYVSSFDGTLYCLTRTDGQVVWRYDQGGYYPVTIERDKIYYATTNRKIVSLDKISGKLLWSVQTSHGLSTQPVYYQGYLIMGDSAGALEVRSENDGHLITAFSPGRGILATPRVVEKTGEVFFISNEANLYSLVLGWKRAL